MEYKFIFAVSAVIILTMASFIVGRDDPNMMAVDPITSIYDIEVNSILGDSVNLSQYKGKKILIVNVASKCGLTPQYSELEQLHKQYSDKLVILGFPSNDFLRQEPDSNEKIAKFCSTKYSISFPLFEKIKVKGFKKHDIYKWLTSPKQNGWNKKGPSWNFTKYLIDENGKLLKRFSPRTSPISDDIINLIK